MKYFLPLLLSALLSCSTGKESTSEATDSTTNIAADSIAPVKTSLATEINPKLSISHDDNIVTASAGNHPLISFTLPDSTTRDFEYEGNNYIVASWKPTDNLSFKSMSFSTRDGACTEYGDEGTSMMLIDTIAVHNDIQFLHSTFDNRAAGTDGIQEIYDLMYKGNCVRFEWIFNWGFNATDEDRVKEFAKIREFLNEVRFEVNP